MQQQQVAETAIVERRCAAIVLHIDGNSTRARPISANWLSRTAVATSNIRIGAK